MAKSLKKRTQEKKPRQHKVSDQKDENTKVLDLGNTYGAAQYTYNISGGTDTITLDPSWTSSITMPSTSYTLSSGTSTVSSWSAFNYGSNVNITKDGIEMQAGTDITVGGKSLLDTIEKIEERLGILKPNIELEDRWDKLKDLRRQYMELEKDILEKEKIMKILKEK